MTARFSGPYLDSKYTKYGELVGGAVVGGAPSGPLNPNPPYGAVAPLLSVIATGNYTPQAAKFTFDAGLSYEKMTSIGGFTANVDYYYNDGFYWEPDNFLRQKHYGLLSSRVRYAPVEKIGISLWGKNLGDKKYATLATTQAGSQ